MRVNSLKRRLEQGDVALGLFVFEFGTIGVTRIAESAGADFMLFDQEHTAWSRERMRALLAACRASGIPSLVRVPVGQSHFIASALDAGAEGVVIPMVESEEQARQIVACAKYPPIGRRGFGLLYADEYLDGDISGTIEHYNREQIVVPQIETLAGLENAERIAAVDGVDMVWFGQFDLTVSLGIPGDFSHPDYAAAVQRVLEAAAAAGKPVGMCCSSFEQADDYTGRGFRCIAFDDISLLESSMRTTVERTRAAASERLQPLVSADDQV